MSGNLDLFVRRTLAISVIALVTSSCGWERKLDFKAPNDKSEIWFRQPWPANGWGLQVVLREQGETRVLYNIRGDVFLMFAEVYWSPDGRIVGVFTCGEPFVKLGYDRRTARKVSFDAIQRAMGDRIRTEYGLSRESGSTVTDPFDWACSTEGHDAFVRMHPGANPR